MIITKCRVFFGQVFFLRHHSGPWETTTTTTTTTTIDNAKKKKNNWFYEQNNSSARASRFLVHFFDVHCTTTTWNLPMRRFMYYVDILRQFSLLYLNTDKALKNSTPGKVAYIWRIEWFQIDAIKFERTHTHYHNDVFTAAADVLHNKVSRVSGP